MSNLNILLITSDQQHWNTLGTIQPRDSDARPRQASVAGHAPSPALIAPTRPARPRAASMITGKYPSQHGAYSLGTKLPESEPTVGDRYFKPPAIAQRLVGKAHFQPLHSTAEYPSLEAYPTLARPATSGQDFDQTFLRIRSCRAGAQPHRRSPCRPALRPLDGRKGAEQLARLLLAADRQRGRTTAQVAHSRALSLQRLDRRAQQRADLAISRRRGARRVSVGGSVSRRPYATLLPLGELLSIRIPNTLRPSPGIRCMIRPTSPCPSCHAGRT